MSLEQLNIRQKQIQLATKMINLNSDWQPDLKYLIYDKIGQSIIAPLLSVEELRNNNIFEYLSIHDKKDPIGVTAVYFTAPTEANIKRICKDLRDGLYEAYYLNFISPIPRRKLEEIADSALSIMSKSDTNSRVKKVYDQYLNYIALENDLFILREAEREHISYHALNRANDESTISGIIDQIVDGLFSLLVTMNIIPIIRSPKSGPAHEVAEKLTKKLYETLKDDRIKLFTRIASQRPLLCIVDRSIDMCTPLQHTWTYQALVHDVLNVVLNQVMIKDENQKMQSFDLGPNDEFWHEHKGYPFPEVAEAIQRKLDEYKKTENELTAGLSDLGDELSKISSAVKTLPELEKRKSNIEKHTTIATAVLNQIKARKLDNFFELEEKIMNRSLIDRVTLDDMLSNPDIGNAYDKYRLFLISYICDNPKYTDDEAKGYMEMLENTFKCNRRAFEYVQSWKTLSPPDVKNLQSKLIYDVGLLKSASTFSKLLSQGSQFVMEGVKNLVLKEHHLPLTKIVDNLMDNRKPDASRSESAEYSYMDPKNKDDDSSRLEKPFQSAIVFVVGGGNYIEYQNLVDYNNSKARSSSGSRERRKVIYGSTDLLNSLRFLEELDQSDRPPAI